MASTTQKIRKRRVMVRLAPRASPDEVLFTDKEAEAVETAAKACGYDAVSTFIREVAAHSAESTVSRGPHWDDYQTVKAAALACNIPLGQWIRDVVLAGCGGSPLVAHQRAALAFVTRKSR